MNSIKESLLLLALGRVQGRRSFSKSPSKTWQTILFMTCSIERNNLRLFSSKLGQMENMYHCTRVSTSCFYPWPILTYISQTKHLTNLALLTFLFLMIYKEQFDKLLDTIHAFWDFYAHRDGHFEKCPLVLESSCFGIITLTFFSRIKSKVTS